MSQTKTATKGSFHFWDRWGIAISSACAVHCLLTPFLLIFYPAASIFFVESEAFVHIFLGLFIIPSAIFVIYTTLKIHKQKKPLIYLAIGLLLIVLTPLLVHDLMGHHAEPYFSILGSLFLIKGHFSNHNHCKSCRSQKDPHCIGEKVFH